MRAAIINLTSGMYEGFIHTLLIMISRHTHSRKGVPPWKRICWPNLLMQPLPRRPWYWLGRVNGPVSNRAQHACTPVLHISVRTAAMWLSMYISCQIRILSDAYDEAPAASDSTMITKGDHKLKRAHLFKMLGVAHTPSVWWQKQVLRMQLWGKDNYML